MLLLHFHAVVKKTSLSSCRFLSVFLYCVIIPQFQKRQRTDSIKNLENEKGFARLIMMQINMIDEFLSKSQRCFLLSQGRSNLLILHILFYQFVVSSVVLFATVVILDNENKSSLVFRKLQPKDIL